VRQTTITEGTTPESEVNTER